jgi:hypothetical protein
MNIKSFAKAHGLVMEVHKRIEPVGDLFPYYAHFKNAEVRDRRLLVGVFGSGRTPQEAISEYAKLISSEKLVIDAGTSARREIQVPCL